MAYGSGTEAEWRYQNESVGSTFGTLVDATWAAGVAFLVVSPPTDLGKRSQIPNDNYKQRVLSTRPMVPSLATGEWEMGVYAHGRSTAVADDARATITSPNFPIAHFLQNAWGGIRLGYRTVIASGTAAAPVVEAGDGVQYEAGDWVFAHDISVDATRGYFRKILSISTDTLTMWAGHDLPFTPAANDVLGAVIQAYPYDDVISNQNHADHLCQSFMRMGELADDMQQAVGVKLSLTGIEGTNAGEAMILRFSAMAAEVTKEGLTKPTAGTPLGDAPQATGTGDDSIVYISAVGSTLAPVEAQSVNWTPGIASQPVPGLVLNGRSGYTLDGGTADSTMIEVVVDYDDSWGTAFRAGTRFQVIEQIGTVAGRAVAVAAMNCEIMEDPERTTSTDLATTTLKLRCLESAASTVATGSALAKVRAKIELLFSCALS